MRVNPSGKTALALSDGVQAPIAAVAQRIGHAADAVSSLPGRPATGDEVASRVLCLCASQASATTGAALRVDSGTIDSIL